MMIMHVIWLYNYHMMMYCCGDRADDITVDIVTSQFGIGVSGVWVSAIIHTQLNTWSLVAQTPVSADDDDDDNACHLVI